MADATETERLAAALEGAKLIDDSAEWAETLHDAAAHMRALRAELEAARADAGRRALLHRALECDGFAYWFPERAIKACSVLADEPETDPPTIDEFRAFIDAAMKGIA